MSNTKPIAYKGMRTPWGKADNVELIAEGIALVGTPGHGGVKLSCARNAKVPDYMREKGGWYEEDCEWSIPFTVFASELTDYIKKRTLNEPDPHITTLRNWYPEYYERFYNVTLAPGESSIRDRQTWNAEHINDLQVVCAYGDWHPPVPKGMVGVVATVGHSRVPGVAERFFLIPADEYAVRGGYSFIVDPSKYQEIEKL